MNASRSRYFAVGSAGLIAALSAATLDAQSYIVRPPARKAKQPAPRSSDSKTLVSIEILTGTRGVDFRARRWRLVFEPLKVPFRIRRGTFNDKIETRETKLGPLRQVTATGKIDRAGKLVFEDREFSISDGARIKEWIDELKTYGSQGSPKGKRLWGLTKAQFGAMYAALATKVEREIAGQPLDAAVSRLGLPAKYPLRFSTAAREWVASEFARVPRVAKKLKGLSCGTALSLALNDAGLGFRPQRTPNGSLEIVIDPLRVASDAWPVGWEFRESNFKTAPSLFKLKPVDLDNVKLVDVLHAVAERSGVPVHLDRYRIDAMGVKLDKLVVSHPRRQTSFSLLLRAITNQHRLTRKLRIDEAGRPFVWITPLAIGRTLKKR